METSWMPRRTRLVLEAGSVEVKRSSSRLEDLLRDRQRFEGDREPHPLELVDSAAPAALWVEVSGELAAWVV